MTTGRTPKALLVGIDGLTIRRLDGFAAPTLKGLRDSAAFAQSQVYPNDDEARTSSGPGWSTIVTGAWPAKHRVLDNDFQDHRLTNFPDLFTIAKRARTDLTTFCFACWPPITQIIVGPDLDHSGGAVEHSDWAAADAENLAEVSRLLSTGDPDAGFLYFGAVDKAGHVFGAASPEYGQAIEQADQRLAQVLGTVRSRPSYPDEDWLIIVTTDHGHRPEGGHGEQSDDERGVFVMALGDAIDVDRATSMQLVDIAPTLLTHLGVEPQQDWDLDGRVVLSR